MKNEQLVGPQAFLHFAEAHEKYAAEISEISKILVQEYAFNEEYTPGEMKAYRQGVQDMVSFFRVCHAEHENKNKQDDSGEEA